MYVLNHLFSEEGKCVFMILLSNLLLLLKCVVRFWHNWIVGGCAVKRQFTTNMSVLLNAQ